MKMNNIDKEGPNLTEPQGAEPSLSDRLAKMFPDLDEGDWASSHPAMVLEHKLLKHRYADTSQVQIEGPTNDPEEVKILSAAMRESVEQRVASARGDNSVKAYEAAHFMSLTFQGLSTFASWFGWRGKLLGSNACQAIGNEVVGEMNFTSAEAQEIVIKNQKVHDKHRKEQRKKEKKGIDIQE